MTSTVDKPKLKKAQDLSGKRFTRLKVIAPHSRDKKRNIKWLCECDCGRQKIIYTCHLKSGGTKSCGCYIFDNRGKLSKTHGMRKTREWEIWQSMVQRCRNKKSRKWIDYGGRGITVCDRWLESFENFYADMGKRPSEKHSLERINNDGNYSPENCKWATNLEQQNNKRNTFFVVFNGEKIALQILCRKLNISYPKIYQRIRYGKMTIDEALQK